MRTWIRKHKVLVLLLGISTLIALRALYLSLSPPPVLKNVSEGIRMMRERNKNLGLVDYGNDTWGPPVVPRNATNDSKTSTADKPADHERP